MNEKDEIKKLLVIAIYAGKIMLRNGGETYRVEDTILRICKSRTIQFAECFVTPTGIFLSMEYQSEVLTYIKRINNRTINLNKIDLINNFSRKFVNKDISLDTALDILDNIDNEKEYSSRLRFFFGGLAGGFFSIMFGGNLLDLIAAFFTSAIVVSTTDYLARKKATFFLSNFIGSIVAAILAMLFSLSGFDFNIDKIIIGSIMPLVPGVAITNAVRDSISGELLSGVSRSLEAIIIAMSIAIGVWIILRLHLLILGGIY